MEEANEVVSPRIGLPGLPVVEWPADCADGGPRGVHRKTHHLIEWADGRPFIWVDDEISAMDAGPVRLLLSEPKRPFEDEPTLDFLMRACGSWGSVETSVETWDGDGLDSFLASLAEDFRGREGARTWHSLCYDLTLSAEHRGSHVQLTWGIHDRAPYEEWHFETTTAHAAGEDMRNLAADIHTFIASIAK